MNEQRFTPKDWALFKSRIVAWQENYMSTLNNEYIALLNGDAAPSEKFWHLDKRIKGDRKRTGVQLEMSRSRFISNLVALLNDGVIHIDDLEGFSSELKETISLILRGCPAPTSDNRALSCWPKKGLIMPAGLNNSD